MSDEDESHVLPPSRREVPSGVADDVQVRAAETMETAPEPAVAAVAPRRSVHFEPVTGQPFVLEVQRSPTPLAPSAEAPRIYLSVYICDSLEQLTLT